MNFTVSIGTKTLIMQNLELGNLRENLAKKVVYKSSYTASGTGTACQWHWQWLGVGEWCEHLCPLFTTQAAGATKIFL